ncbi:MAG: hypothetical protein AAF752_00505 [Bacteroidota bacterium]
MNTSLYETGVFVNVPFDQEYAGLFNAIVFSVVDCGFTPRCALEESNSAEVRIEKLYKIISECRYGVHDISRTELDAVNGLPRFNMPLELGIFLGARQFGQDQQKTKVALVMDREKYRYQKFCSDIAGQDVSSHSGKEHKAVKVVRDWLRATPTARARKGLRLPSGAKVYERYQLFSADLPLLCAELDLDPNELIYNDFTTMVSTWVRENK